MRLSGQFFIIVISVLSAASLHSTGDSPKLKLKVSNTSIELGGKVQVNWRSKNASKFIVVTGPEHKKTYTGKKRPRKTRRGQIILQPVRSGEFTFTVSNKHGKTEKTIFIEVNSDTVAPETPLITSFLVSGVSVSVSWDTTTDNKSTHENIDYLLYSSNDPNESDFSDLPHEVYKGEERGRIEGLSERSRYYIYLVARDEAGNTSAPAGPLEINTMEQNTGVDILPDLVIRDLIKLNLTYSKTDLDIKVRKTGLNIEFMPGDIVVEYQARRISYSRVLFVSDLGDEVLLDIEPVEPLELLTEGEVNVGGLQYIEAQSSESKADMPLSVITVPFKDDFSSSFKGKVEGVNVEGKLSGRANINMKVFEGGFSSDIHIPMVVSAKLDYKVSIEKLIIEKEIAPKRSFESKPVLILIGGRLPVLVYLKGEFGWEMKATVDPGVGFSLELTANPMVHERVVAGELIGIKHTSHSGLGEAQSSQTLSGTGNVEAGLFAVGTITIVGWDALTLSAEPKFASSLEASVEAVPKYEVLKEYYGDSKIQIGKFTTGTKGDMSLIAAINIPFGEVLDISRDFELFDRRLWELPNISLSSTSDECSTVTHMASIDDSKKGHVYSKTLAWGSVVDGIRGYREGPSGEKEWVQGYPDSTITTVVSGYGELGESFRRYTAVDFTPASTLRYYVEGFGENAYGASPSQACQRWADKIGSDPDYVLISSDGGMCVWAFDGVSETDLDFYWPVDSVDACQ